MKSNDSSVAVDVLELDLEDVLSRGSAVSAVDLLVGERASSESRLAAHCMRLSYMYQSIGFPKRCFFVRMPIQCRIVVVSA